MNVTLPTCNTSNHMTTAPKTVLKEFGIDVDGKDPDGQYQWKMLSLKAGSEERKRIEKAWSAFILDRREVPREKVASHKGAHDQVPMAGPWVSTRKWIYAVGILLLGIGLLWLLLHDSAQHNAGPPVSTNADAKEWSTKYEALKAMMDESGHGDEHHDEFILLSETAKAAIMGGQAPAMLDRINADLAAEGLQQGARPITALAAHKAQWKVIVQALIMNEVGLLDHAKFEGHHEGEL